MVAIQPGKHTEILSTVFPTSPRKADLDCVVAHRSRRHVSAKVAPSPLVTANRDARLRHHARSAAGRAMGSAFPFLPPVPPARYERPIDVMTLADLYAPGRLQEVRGTKPWLISIDQETLQAEHAVFNQRLSPLGLECSPMAHEPILLLRGEDAQGRFLRNHATTLADMLAPLKAGRAVEGCAYFSVMINPDRTVRFLDSRAPTSLTAWDSYVHQVAPPWPVELLHDVPGGAEAKQPFVNSSVVLSVGIGDGAPYHKHAANLYLQVHGRKKWSIYGDDEFKVFLHPNEPQPPGQLALLDPAHMQALARPDWVPVAGLPAPIEFISEPGQMVYIPRDWYHATWSVDNYTAAYIKHNDND